MAKLAKLTGGITLNAKMEAEESEKSQKKFTNTSGIHSLFFFFLVYTVGSNNFNTLQDVRLFNRVIHLVKFTNSDSAFCLHTRATRV